MSITWAFKVVFPRILLVSPSRDVHRHNLFEVLANFWCIEFCSFSDPINRQGLKWISKLLHDGGQTSCTQIKKKKHNYLWVFKFILKWNHHILHWLWLRKNNCSVFSDSCQPSYSWTWILFCEHSNENCWGCNTVGNGLSNGKNSVSN